MMSSSFVVGERVEVDGFYATVRYVGPLKDDSSELWVGLEWDDISRGKHSGEAFGTQFFTPTVPGSASFARAAKLPHVRVGLMEAVRERYAAFSDKTEGEEEEGKDEAHVLSSSNGKVLIEVVGAEKLMKRQAKLEGLMEMSVRGLHVSFMEDVKDGKIFESLQMIDASSNLFDDINIISILSTAFPRLSTLNLSENRFTRVTHMTPISVIPPLRTLVLNETHIPWGEGVVKEVLCSFPHLESLYFKGNNVCDLASEHYKDVKESKLSMIDLTDNRVSSWEAVEALARAFPRLKRLLMAGNPIPSILPIPARGETGVPEVLCELEALSLSGSHLDGWSSLDALNALPRLYDLRIGTLPWLNDLTSLQARQRVIARMPHLRSFNGSNIRPKERVDAEKSYLRMTLSIGSMEITDELIAHHPQLPRLIKLHGDPREILRREAQLGQKGSMVTVFVSSVLGDGIGKEAQSKKFPLSMKIMRLRAVLGRVFGIEPSEQKLYYYPAEEKEFPICLDDDRKTLIDYGIMEDGGKIVVEENVDGDGERVEDNDDGGGGGEEEDETLAPTHALEEARIQHMRDEIEREKAAAKRAATRKEG